jgi:hypothetical protein
MPTKKPVNSFYYSEAEWNRLGCGPLPPERDRDRAMDFTPKQKSDMMARANPKIDNNVIKGDN